MMFDLVTLKLLSSGVFTSNNNWSPLWCACRPAFEPQNEEMLKWRALKPKCNSRVASLFSPAPGSEAHPHPPPPPFFFFFFSLCHNSASCLCSLYPWGEAFTCLLNQLCAALQAAHQGATGTMSTVHKRARCLSCLSVCLSVRLQHRPPRNVPLPRYFASATRFTDDAFVMGTSALHFPITPFAHARVKANWI